MENSYFLRKITDFLPQTIAIVIVFFNIIGNFGNFNVIFVTFRVKNLQTKHGWLLVILCAEHSMCLLFEFINVYFALSGTQVTRRTCLFLLSPYLCISFMQSITFMTLAMDVLISLTWPLQYQKWKIRDYCIILAISPIIFPIGLMAVVWSRVTDEIVFLCNPPLAMDHQTVDVWGGFTTGVNLMILVVYGYVFLVSRRMKKTTRHARNTAKIMRSLTILVLVFCFSWVTCMAMVFLSSYVSSNQLVVTLIQSYAVIFAAIAYSQTFYVYYFRSEVYRKEFKKQICKVKESSKISSKLKI